MFTRQELVEVSDAISTVLSKYITEGDPEHHEKKYGTLTLLHEAQAKILPAAFSFEIHETPWGPARAMRIAEIRAAQGLPEIATPAERAGWEV